MDTVSRTSPYRYAAITSGIHVAFTSFLICRGVKRPLSFIITPETLVVKQKTAVGCHVSFPVGKNCASAFPKAFPDSTFLFHTIK